MSPQNTSNLRSIVSLLGLDTIINGLDGKYGYMVWLFEA